MTDDHPLGMAGEKAPSQVYAVFVTVPDTQTGLALAREVVEARLAACGNLIPGLTSVYRWEGKVHQDPESLIIFKTTAGCLPAMRKKVVELHPYEVPELLALPTVDGHPPYLEWVIGEVEESGRA